MVKLNVNGEKTRYFSKTNCKLWKEWTLKSFQKLGLYSWSVCQPNVREESGVTELPSKILPFKKY